MVGDIDCIVALFGYFRYPLCCAIGTSARSDYLCIGHTGTSEFERILLIHIIGFDIGKTGVGGRFPFSILRITGSGGIVVHYHLMQLVVTFSWQQHDGTGILEHRYQEGEDITLGVDIFHSLKNPSSLPLPTLERLFVIISVTLPEGNMAFLKSFSYLMAFGEIGYQRYGGPSTIVGYGPTVIPENLVGCFSAEVARYQILERQSDGAEGK